MAEYQSKLSLLQMELNDTGKLAQAEKAQAKIFEDKLLTQEKSAAAGLELKAVEVAALASAAAGKDAELRALTGRIEALSAEKSAAAGELAKAEAEGRALRSQLELKAQDQESKVREFEAKLADSQAVIALLREQSANAGAQRMAAENQAREMEREVRKIMALREEEFAAAQARAVASDAAQERDDSEIARLGEQLAARDRQMQLLEQNLLEQGNTQAIERELQAVRGDLINRDQAVAQLEAEAALLSQVREGLREREAEIDGLRLQLRQAQAERVDARRQLADREELVGAWESRYEALAGQMHAQAAAHRQRAEEVKPLARAAAAAGEAGAGAAGFSRQSADPRQPEQQDLTALQARLRLVALRGVQFLPGSDELLPESYVILDDALRALRQIDPAERVEVGGHTDSWGEADHNRDLSQRRAESVCRYLIENGADAARLTPAGFGDSRPIADNASPDGRFANRRIEFQLRGTVR